MMITAQGKALQSEFFLGINWQRAVYRVLNASGHELVLGSPGTGKTPPSTFSAHFCSIRAFLSS